MTRMFVDAFERVTIRAQRASNHSSARCQWDLTMDGIRSSLICQTSQDEHMGLTTLKHSEYRSTPTAEFAESTSPTDFTPRMSYRRSSNSIFLFKAETDDANNSAAEGSWAREEHGTLNVTQNNSCRCHITSCIVVLDCLSDCILCWRILQRKKSSLHI